MLGTKIKCPGIVKNFLDNDVLCGYEGHTVLEEGIYAPENGYDPLACKVKCRACGHVYIVFPAVNFNQANSEVG